MLKVSVVTVVFIHTMEDDQRLDTLVYEGDALRFSARSLKITIASPSCMYSVSDIQIKV